MPEIPLNPGFLLLLGGLLVLAAPRGVRPFIMGGAGALALWLLLENDFGAADAVRQMNLPVVLLDLDALNRIFGIAALIALITLSIYGAERRNRYEDAAVLMLAGATVAALFVGDLISFVAAASFAGIAAAWIVFCSSREGAGRAGVRLLIWNGLEGLLLVAGVAFHLSDATEASALTQLDVNSIGGACIFAALMIRIGAPFAHVWLKDTIAHASPFGGAALSAFSAMVGVYALARLFPAEPLLMFAGAAMMVIGVLYAAAADDLRAGAGYGLVTQIGVCVALIGVGSPLALAAAEGHMFAVVVGFTALQMALGVVVERLGEARLSQFAGVGRAMPITCALLLLCGVTIAGAPGFAGYVSLSVGLEATSSWELRWLWLLMSACAAGLFIAITLRPQLAAHRASAAPLTPRPVAFPRLLGSAVAAFFCLSIGLAPDWLYGLMPALSFAPFAWDRVAPQVELLGAAGVVFVLLYALRLWPQSRALRILDVDALYRGPVAAAGRWSGVVLLRVYGAWRTALGALASRVAAAMAAWTRSCDQPYPGRGWAALQFWVVSALVVTVLVGARL